ncbi:pdz domain-containing protein gipc1 [Lasius niger]|uniref:Pdz domain-containing protein gipc1 n=1 Tax=Lasius niger TaxID=67767 RepID=A0A0J7KT11_LASNI|nr:pdz domain-containing protein gipc1 [Lasius niger]
MQYDWRLLANHENIRTLTEYVERSRMFTMAYLIFVGTGACTFVTAPITVPILDIVLASNVTRPKKLPHSSEFFLDLEKYYYILLVITWIGYFVSCTTVIAVDTIYFAMLQHSCGRPKEIELVKTDDALGLTITDNGAGYAFIKRIKEGSVIDRIKVIEVGDHIERINLTSLVGRRHFEVARMLKDIPKGSTFTLRLVEPQKNGFGSIGPRGDPKKGKKVGYGSGKETLRFKADGSTQIIEQIDDAAALGVEKINTILESFMGISDTELATQIWELAEGKCNSIDFAEAIDNSDLEDFGFTDEFVIELWGAITDARAGRHR